MASASASSSGPSASAPQPSDAQVESSVKRSEQSALARARRNVSYLYDPTSDAHRPVRFRTRALLRSLHYLSVFVFWRVVRYAKYVAAGLAVSALSATALGSVVTGAAWIVAPPTFTAAVGVGLIWAVGKYGFRKARQRVGKTRAEEVKQGVELGGPVPEPIALQNTFV